MKKLTTNKTKWQDKAIMITNFGFGIMIIPMIIASLNGSHTPLLTTIPTMLGLYFLAFTFYTMKLYLSVVSCLFSGTFWLVLLLSGMIQ
jgi:hypothetical protein